MGGEGGVRGAVGEGAKETRQGDMKEEKEVRRRVMDRSGKRRGRCRKQEVYGRLLR